MLKSRLLIAAVIIVAVAPFIGEQVIRVDALLSHDELSTRIFFDLRVPRVLLGFIAGATLSLCGVVYQGLFRNLLASPFTLGISGGAAFGMALAVKLGLVFSIFGVNAYVLCAMIGAFVTMAVILFLSRRSGGASVTVILSGVVLSFFFSSLIMLLQYLGDFAEVFRITHWMLGSIDTVGFSSILMILPPVLAGSVLLFSEARALNLIALGDEIALTKGVELRRVQAKLLFASSLLIGAVVSVCGPIGFVGIIIPFLTRLMLGYEHRVVMIGSMLLGGSVLVVSDTIARTLVAPAEVPVGVITALIGGPIFVWALLSGRFFSPRDAVA